jgi:hypothetical protein
VVTPEAGRSPEVAPGVPPEASQTDAELRRALARAMVMIGRAMNPQAALLEHENLIRAAARRLGPDSSIARLLAALATARAATPALEPEHQLPEAAARAFFTMLKRELNTDPSQVQIVEAIGSDAEGWDFNYSQDGVVFGAFCIKSGEQWVFAPGPIGREDLFAMTQAFRRHFDFTVAISMNANGATDAEIEAARDAIRPVRALWEGERDPHGLCDKFPLVFTMVNATGTQRTFYCAYDPMSAKAESYDFG